MFGMRAFSNTAYFSPRTTVNNAPPLQNVRIQPLKGHNAFDLIFEHGARFAYRGVTGFLLFRHTVETSAKQAVPELERFRRAASDTVFVGVSSKRRTRPAVMRNRLKRLLRASVQAALWKTRAMPFYADDAAFPLVAVVLICNIIPEKPSLLHLADIQPLVERIFANADKHFRSKHNHNHNTKSQ